MMFLIFILALVGHIQAQIPGLGFGPAYIMQRTSSYLVEYSTTLRAPKAPESQRGLVVVWPGINTDATPTNLAQTCIGAGTARSSFCPRTKVAANQWCAFTSANIASTNTQRAGSGVAVDVGKDLSINYKYDGGTKQFSQTLTIDGKEVSKLSLALGKGKRFNTAVEIWPVTDLKAYKNSTFKFAAADPGFPKSIMMGKGITASTPVSNDGGKTWTVDRIVIPDSSYGGAGGKSYGGKF